MFALHNVGGVDLAGDAMPYIANARYPITKIPHEAVDNFNEYDVETIAAEAMQSQDEDAGQRTPGEYAKNIS